MELIHEEHALARLLHGAQRAGEKHVQCELSASFATRITEARLRAMADLMLPRAQTRRYQLHRLRDGTLHFGVTITLRQGVRIATAVQRGAPLPAGPDAQTLAVAQKAIRALPSAADGGERFRRLFQWLCAHAEYANASPGEAGYPALVEASGALVHRRANCQGFADAYYLLCALAGLTADYQTGYARKGTHLWNLIQMDDGWFAADASRGSRLLREGGENAMWMAFCMDENAYKRFGFRVEDWMAIQKSL